MSALLWLCYVTGFNDDAFVYYSFIGQFSRLIRMHRVVVTFCEFASNAYRGAWVCLAVAGDITQACILSAKRRRIDFFAGVTLIFALTDKVQVLA